MSVPEQIAQEALLVRVLTKLSKHFSTALATINTQAATAGLPTVPTPAPASTSYYIGIDIAQVERILSNSTVAVFVFPAAPPEDIEVFSGETPEVGFVNVSQAFQVLVAYRVAMYEPQPSWGKTQSQWDVMTQRGLRYNAAVTDIIRKKLRGGAGVQEIFGSDSLPGETRLTEDGEPLIGYASTVWSIDQYVQRPYGCEE